MTDGSQFADRPSVPHIYEDPLDLIWLHAAAAAGMTVRRVSDVFASWDGNGTLSIGVPETLDPDDTLAQMILHEMCHALTEGPDAFHLPDWGIQITNPKHRYREHACLRLQAALTAEFGLRKFLAATTSFRSYYDSLPDNPLEPSDDPAVRAAVSGWERAVSGPWSDLLHDALQATAQIAEVVRSVAPPESLWTRVENTPQDA